MADENESITTSLDNLKNIETSYSLIKESLKTVGEQSEILYKAIVSLQDKGIIDKSKSSQKCPLCGTENALIKGRIDSILSTAAIQEEIQKIEESFVNELYHLQSELKTKFDSFRILLPKDDNCKLNLELHKFVKQGYYDIEWCNLEDKNCINSLDYE